MKKLVLVILAGALAIAPARAAFATEPGGPSMEEMMKQWEKIAAPGEHHRMFERYVGHWDATVRSWMDPSAPPMESKGTSDFAVILGGRWLQQTFHGSMMGMPFEGYGLTGYDNFRQEYVSTWMDNMSTGMMKMTGQCSADGRTSDMSGLMDEPMTGEKDKKVRSHETWKDDSTIVFEMFDNIPGKGEVKVMEITYTRGK